MELFYTAAEQVDFNARILEIDGDEFHHLVRVLRKKVGDTIFVTDGFGFRYEVTITDVGKKVLRGEILSYVHCEPPSTEVTVAISLLKAPQRFDFFLEKATELGVSTIIPMITARTISQPSHEKVPGKLSRWKTIALSAARQSKRLYLPALREPLSFSKVLELAGYDAKLMPYEGSTLPPMAQCVGKKVLFLVGGEGGFTEAEVQSAEAAGFSPLSFGNTILRAETAGIFAVAYVRSQLLNAESSAWI